MPVELLKYEELNNFLNNNNFDTIVKPNLLNQNQTLAELKSVITKKKETWVNNIPFLNEIAKSKINLREIVSITQRTNYTRS